MAGLAGQVTTANFKKYSPLISWPLGFVSSLEKEWSLLCLTTFHFYFFNFLGVEAVVLLNSMSHDKMKACAIFCCWVVYAHAHVELDIDSKNALKKSQKHIQCVKNCHFQVSAEQDSTIYHMMCVVRLAFFDYVQLCLKSSAICIMEMSFIPFTTLSYDYVMHYNFLRKDKRDMARLLVCR